VRTREIVAVAHLAMAFMIIFVIASACCPGPRRQVYSQSANVARCREQLVLEFSEKPHAQVVPSARSGPVAENVMLNVDLDIRAADGQAVVSLSGEFRWADAPGVAAHLIVAVAACGPSVIVDLAGLESIGYSGLAVLLRIRKWTRRSGGNLALAAPQPAVHLMLKATGLIDVFPVYRSVDEAASGQEFAAAVTVA
jgi:anti-anti-sigma factor